MAENPQQTVRELQELVVDYVKQETVGPLRDLVGHVGFALGGATVMGLGFLFFEIGLLRLIQYYLVGEPPALANGPLSGNWSWVPYILTVLAAAIVAGLVWWIRSRKKASEL